MLRIAGIWVALFLASPAHADACPSFFRFVDFGLHDSAGGLLRGGPLLRGESLHGTTLLALEDTHCEKVRDIARDGHGNPIPVVSSISYNVAKTGLDLTELRVSVLGDAAAAAEDSAKVHRARLGTLGVVAFKGETALCASIETTLSCQLISPYKGPAALVVYCAAGMCRMPVLAMDDRIAISAAWAVDSDFRANPEAAGAQVFERVQNIHAFLAPLSSGF